MADTKIAVVDPNVYQRWASALEQTAARLDQTAREVAGDSGSSIKQAGKHGVATAEHVGASVIGHPLAAGLHAGVGTLDAVDAGIDAAKGVGYAVAGGIGWLGRELYDGVRDAYVFALSSLAKGLNALKNALERHLHRFDSQQHIERSILADPDGQRWSKTMFARSGDSFKLAGTELLSSLDNYTAAVLHLGLGTPVNAVAAAYHLACTIGNVGMAAGEIGAAGAVKVAELGVRAAKVSIKAAEKSEALAADALGVATKALVAAANAAGRDQHALKPGQIKELEAKLTVLEQRLAEAV